jgi:hypothetical protein
MTPERPSAGAAAPSRRIPSHAWNPAPAGAELGSSAERASALASWPTHPVSAIVWGPTRDLNNVVAFALASDLDPAPFWLEIEAPETSDRGRGPVQCGWLSPDRTYLSRDPADLEPRPFPVRGMREYIRRDEPDRADEVLSGFLCLPNVVQEIASRAAPAPWPRVIAFANSERTPALFRRSDGPVLYLLEALREAGISVVFSFTGRPPVDRLGFDVVLRLHGPPPDGGEDPEFTCERTLARGPFRVGEATRLSGVRPFSAALDRYRSTDPP